jgi:hypothetical protein
MIQIDVWGGDMHTELVREHQAKSWTQAAKIIEQEVETGMLVNVLHIDFKAPADLAQETIDRIVRGLGYDG